MTRIIPLLSLLAWSCAVQAALHHLLASSKYRNTISALEFDDKTETLSLLKQSSTLTQHSSIAVDFSKKFVHAAFDFNSSVLIYNLGADYSLSLNLSAGYALGTGACDPLKQPIKSRLISSAFSPNLVYSSVYSDSKLCSIVNWAHPDGTHASNWHSVESNAWRIDKLVLRSDNETMYGLDTAKQAVITWRVFRDEPDRVINYNFRESYFDSWLDQTNGSIVDFVASPKQFIAVKDKSNEILTIGVSEEGWAPGHNDRSLDEIMYTGSQKIIAETNDTLAKYKTTSLAASVNRKYVWTASPAITRVAGDNPGIITVFATNVTTGELGSKLFQEHLDAELGAGPVDAGDITAAIVAAPFADEYVAVSSYPAGQIEIWKVEDEGKWLKYVTKWEGGQDCCEAVVWVD